MTPKEEEKKNNQLMRLNLEQQTQASANESRKIIYLNQLGKCWKTVENLAKKGKKGAKIKVSNRIKYMLQDLMEMRKNGWKTRRKEETAKTIQEIHKEVEKKNVPLEGVLILRDPHLTFLGEEACHLREI